MPSFYYGMQTLKNSGLIDIIVRPIDSISFHVISTRMLHREYTPPRLSCSGRARTHTRASPLQKTTLRSDMLLRSCSPLSTFQKAQRYEGTVDITIWMDFRPC